MSRRKTKQYISAEMSEEMIASMMDLVPTPQTTPAQTPVEFADDELFDSDSSHDSFDYEEDEITMETRAMIDNAIIQMDGGETSNAFIGGKSICVHSFRQYIECISCAIRVCFRYEYAARHYGN